MDKEEVLKIVREELGKVLTQPDYLPDSIKSRHIGEGVRFIRAGLIADRPTTPERDGACYFATDENKLYVGDTGAWLEETFT